LLMRLSSRVEIAVKILISFRNVPYKIFSADEKLL